MGRWSIVISNGRFPDLSLLNLSLLNTKMEHTVCFNGEELALLYQLKVFSNTSMSRVEQLNFAYVLYLLVLLEEVKASILPSADI
jgi:hypothetical protein